MEIFHYGKSHTLHNTQILLLLITIALTLLTITPLYYIKLDYTLHLIQNYFNSPSSLPSSYIITPNITSENQTKINKIQPLEVHEYSKRPTNNNSSSSVETHENKKKCPIFNNTPPVEVHENNKNPVFNDTLPIESHEENASVINKTQPSEFDRKRCDMFKGEWVQNKDGPYYTSDTCGENIIHDHQNCMKYGRPDTEFMKWRWRPFNEGCDLRIFDSIQFLEIVRGKSLAFVGDSVGRNQMQSLMCLLSKVEKPIDVSITQDWRYKRWIYRTYNCTIAIFWSPHLVKVEEANPNDPTHTGILNLFLDEFDRKWTTQIEEFNYVIMSAGHWFFRPSYYYLKHKVVGCLYCTKPKVNYLPSEFAYKRAFRTAFKAINSLKKFKGTIFLRTFAPSHFDGRWNEGANCVRTRPFRPNETSLVGTDLEFYKAQLKEFRIAKRRGDKNGLKKFRLLDITKIMLLRPDGHPSKYGHLPNVTTGNDCVHWCLPGPIDTWNEILLGMLKMDQEG